MSRKKKKQRQYKKDIRKKIYYIKPQTEFHINEMCAWMGISEKQGGKAIDKMVAICQAMKGDFYEYLRQEQNKRNN